MLRNLNIKNLALVDDVKVGFDQDLNVITGETGAGKSLLIGALRLLLGERADAVDVGAAKAVAEAGVPSSRAREQRSYLGLFLLV